MTAPALEPVTVVVSRRVKPGKEAEYEAWIREITRIGLGYQGHLGMNVFRPQRAGDPYVLVYKFDSGAHLDKWLTSAERERMVKIAETLVDESHVQHVSGLESWFTMPGATEVVAPPKWKMALVTSAAVWLMAQLLDPAAQRGAAFLPAPLVGLLMTLVMVGLLTWLVMPRLTQLLAPWLFAEKPSPPKA